MPLPGKPETHRTALGVVLFVLLMDVIGITILYPVAPYLVKRYSDDAFMVTLLTVLYAVGQFFASPLLGKLGDRYGRRPVLLVSVLGSAIGYVVFGLGCALWLLLLSRLIAGITAASMSTASAYIVDVSKPEERAKDLGLVGVAWGIGLVLGPAIGAFLGEIALTAPAYAAAGLTFLSVLLMLFLLPESPPKAQRENTPIRISDLTPFLSVKTMARLPSVGRLFLTLCLFNLAFNGINSIQTLFLIEKFTLQPRQLGMLLAVTGFTVAVVQAVLVQRLVSRYRKKPVGVASLLGQASIALAISLAPNFALIASPMVLSSALSTLTFPTISALASNRVTLCEQGILMGVIAALGSLMGILGPLCAGVIYDHIGSGAPYWLGAVIYASAGSVLSRQAFSGLRQGAA